MLSVEEVIREVALIKAISHDDEAAHGMEDALHQRVLRAIAREKCVDPVACAREALKTDKIKFERWCA